jgi:outer membrane protein OmpA-like peptidoglycan-associated protein
MRRARRASFIRRLAVFQPLKSTMSLLASPLRSVSAALLVLAVSACATKAPPPPPPAPAPYKGAVLQIEQTERGVLLVLPSTVLFEPGKAEFKTADAAPYLDRLALLLTTKSDKRVAVEGHTDSDGTAALNDALSKARATAVAEALGTRNVKRERMDIAGFSFKRPVASNATEDGKRLNRRVELIVLEEKVAAFTNGEPAGAFESAWAKLKALVEQGLVKPVEQAKP